MGFFRKHISRTPTSSSGASTTSQTTQVAAHSNPYQYAQPRTQLQTRNPNTSTSNLSTTSTLLEPARPHTRPVPHPRPHPHHQTHRHESAPHTDRDATYEAFLHAAEQRERQQEHAWRQAEKRRMADSGRHWPDDPWRGGFGPPVVARREGEVRLRVGERVGGERGRLGVGGRDVTDWLRVNGLRR
jgi:hypothetical protein